MGLNQNLSLKFILSMAVATTAMGCSNGAPSFSLLEEKNAFSQVPQVTNGKIDVLWVIDNSGSMASSQQNIADNFASFIDKFNAKGFDYRMAVITSDSFMANFGAGDTIAKFRDGTNATGHTGAFVITPDTPNVTATFLTNMIQGINGSGDERVFQSIKTSLSHTINAEFGFPREDAFLSVIIVSDEDDFSHDGPEARGGQYNYSGLHSVDSYIQYLDQVTGGSATDRQFNVNSVAILDQQCLDDLNAQSPGRKIGVRYQQMSEATKGIIGSLCGDFAETLSNISNRIIQLTTRFPLTRKPNPATIRVWVDGQEVPNDAANGFSYDEESNSIVFNGTQWVPDAGAQISVSFDPVTIK